MTVAKKPFVPVEVLVRNGTMTVAGKRVAALPHTRSSLRQAFGPDTFAVTTTASTGYYQYSAVRFKRDNDGYVFVVHGRHWYRYYIWLCGVGLKAAFGVIPETLYLVRKDG